MIRLPKDLSFILASSSPRRVEFLKTMGITCETIKPSFDEIYQKGTLPLDYVKENSLGKAQSVFSMINKANYKKIIILAADTVVVLDGDVIEKPKDENDAKRMLKRLSGRTHEVLTGLCLLFQNQPMAYYKFETRSYKSLVSFKTLSDQEIDDYVATKEPLDKAGSYAIQGKGSFIVKSIEGSFTNVVGLPLAELVDWCQEII